MRLFIVFIILMCGEWREGFTGQNPQPVHLTLGQALKKAQEVSFAVLVADARVQQAIARLGQARSLLLPQVSGEVLGSRQTRDLRATGISFPAIGTHIGPFNAFDARGKITQTLFDAGAFERLRAAKLGEKLSASQLQKAREDALALVAMMYIQAQRAVQHVQLTHAFLKRDQKALALARGKFSQGTGSRLELKQARANYAQSRYSYRVAKTDAQEKRLDVAAALKIPLDVPIIFEGNDYRDLDIKGAKDIPIDVNVARDQLSVQEAQATAAHSDYYPKITAAGDYGRSGKTPDQGSNTYMVGLQVEIPIWEGGRKQADLAEARARVKEAQAVLDDTQQQAQVRIMDARANMERAKVLIKTKTAALVVADEEMKIALDRRRWGIGHEFDVDMALAQKAYVQDERREAVALLWMAKISLAHALGHMQALLKE